MNKTLQVIVLTLLAVAGTARAQSYVYDWTYSSSLYTGSGTLTVDPSMPQNGGVDAYVPVISGTFNGQTITGLDTSGDYNNFFYFQDAHGSYVLTSPTQPLWQVYEFAFTTAADEYVMNSNGDDGNPMAASEFETFDFNNGGSGVFGSDDAYDAVGNANPVGTFSITAVPEPSVNGLFLGTAILWIGLRSWRARRGAGLVKA